MTGVVEDDRNGKEWKGTTHDGMLTAEVGRILTEDDRMVTEDGRGRQRQTDTHDHTQNGRCMATPPPADDTWNTRHERRAEGGAQDGGGAGGCMNQVSGVAKCGKCWLRRQGRAAGMRSGIAEETGLRESVGRGLSVLEE